MSGIIKCGPGTKRCGKRCVKMSFKCASERVEQEGLAKTALNKSEKAGNAVRNTRLGLTVLAVGGVVAMWALTSSPADNRPSWKTDTAIAAGAVALTAGLALKVDHLFTGANSDRARKAERKAIINSDEGKELMARMEADPKFKKDYDQFLADAKGLKNNEIMALPMDESGNKDIGVFYGAITREKLGNGYSVVYNNKSGKRGIYVMKRKALDSLIQFGLSAMPKYSVDFDLNGFNLAKEVGHIGSAYIF